MRRAAAVVLLVCAGVALLLVAPRGAKADGSQMLLTLTQSSPSSRVGEQVTWTAAVNLQEAGDDLLAGWQVDFRSDAGWTSGPVATDDQGLARFTTTGAVDDTETVVAVLVTRGCEGVQSAPARHDWEQPTLTLQVPGASSDPTPEPDPNDLEAPRTSSVEVVALLEQHGEAVAGSEVELVESFRPEPVPIGRQASTAKVEEKKLTKTTDALGRAVFTLDHKEPGIAELLAKEIVASPAVPAQAAASHVWSESVDVFFAIRLELPAPAPANKSLAAVATVTSTPYVGTTLSVGGHAVRFEFSTPAKTSSRTVEVDPGDGRATTEIPPDLAGVITVRATLVDPGEGQDYDRESTSGATERFVPDLSLLPDLQVTASPVGSAQSIAATAAHDGRPLEGVDVQLEAKADDASAPLERHVVATNGRGHAGITWTRESSTLDAAGARLPGDESDREVVFIDWREQDAGPGGADSAPLLVSLQPVEAREEVGTTTVLTATVLAVHQVPDEGGLGRRAQPETLPASGVEVDVSGDLGFVSRGLVTDAEGEASTGYSRASVGRELVVAAVRLGGCDEVVSGPVSIVTTPTVSPPPVTTPPVTTPPVTTPPVTTPPVTTPPVTTPPVTRPPITEPPVPEGPETSASQPPTTEPPPTSEPPTPEPPSPTPSSVPRGGGSGSTAVHPGGPLVVAGDGCGPGEAVTIRLGGAVVGTTTADAEGGFRLETVVPDMRLGRYQLSSSCGATSTEPVDVTRTETVSGRVGAAATAVGGVLVFFALAGASMLRRVGG